MKNSWIFIFPLLIIVAITYLAFFDTESQVELIKKQTLLQKQAIAALGDLPENTETIKLYMKHEEIMNAIGPMFQTHCASCHGKQGKGLAAPNLCDDSYITIQTLTDLIPVIQNGNISKGMNPYKDILTQTEIVLLASYVANLRGTSKEGKFPEGKQIDQWSK
jgi:cytochrome c oxidase cbb3-type subunit 3